MPIELLVPIGIFLVGVVIAHVASSAAIDAARNAK
jgi:hypothetical protein